MTNQQISANQLKELRDRGLISNNEIAFLSGDLIVVEDVISGQKRVLGETSILSENSKRLLKG